MKIMITALVCLATLLSLNSPNLGAPFQPPQDVILYVREGGTSATCTGWENACDLQTALQLADALDEVWVAAGNYYPTAGTDRSISFTLESGVAIYGGFPATGGDWTSRDWVTNATTMSGDIGTPEDRTDNSYQIVTASNVDNTAILDGFTITASYRYGLGNKGGGMYNDHSSPTLTNLIFLGNYSFLVGGGMYNVDSNPALNNVTFMGNEAFFYNDNYGGGGGMYNERSSPTLTDVTFSENTASGYYGGGMYNLDSSPTLVNVTFAGNTAWAYGGGGMYNKNSNPSLTNVTFSENSGQGYDGGGMYNDDSSPVLTNATFYNNTASRGCGIFNANNSSLTLTNTIIWGASSDPVYNDASTTTITYSIVQGGYAGEGNIDADPLLQDLLANSSLTRTHALKHGSPAIDNGSSAHCPVTDQRGNHRPVDGDGDGTPQCDIGAYEIQLKTWYVKQDSVATGCDSWENACGDLQAALALATPGDQIWVTQGTYTPHSLDRSATFQLESFVKIFGGFLGNETSSSQREWENNHTVLSGEIGIVGEVTDNSYHIVTGSGADIYTVLDGFTITGSYSTYEDDMGGGGMYNMNGSPTLNQLIFMNNQACRGGGMYNEESSPVMTNITFSDNIAFGSGGGMYNLNSNPSLTNVTFSNNQTQPPANVTGSRGGGMSNLLSNPVLTNVTFLENLGFEGGGMNNDLSSPILTNVAFIGNTADATGGDGGGGMRNNESSPILTNVTFSSNHSVKAGGGMYNGSYSNPVLTNVTFFNNSASLVGGGIMLSDNSILMNAILWGNIPDQIHLLGAPTITYSVIQDGCPAGATCSNIITENPLLGALADNGGFTQTHALEEGSPAIDAGNPDPATCPVTDQRGFHRPVDGDNDGVHRCDIGAYEYGATDWFFINLPLILR